MDLLENYLLLSYRPAAWLKVTGEDAAAYLQGQFSQDLRGLATGGSTYGLLLNHKGRIQADAFIVKAADGFWIGSYECTGESLRSRLESFIVADDVILEDQTAEWAGLCVMKPSEAPPTSRPTGSPGSSSGSLQGFRALDGLNPPHPLFCFPGRRSRAETWEWIFPLAQAQEVERDLRARLGSVRIESPEFWERARITAAIPSVPRDAGPADLPQEVGLVASAVSFTKGCYLGQEIMARLKTRGRIRRQLRQVRFPTAVGVSAPGLLFDGERSVGELRSWVSDGQGGFIGFAMTPADAAPAAKFSFAPGGPPLIELAVL